jgi:hypothetical protein
MYSIYSPYWASIQPFIQSIFLTALPQEDQSLLWGQHHFFPILHEGRRLSLAPFSLRSAPCHQAATSSTRHTGTVWEKQCYTHAGKARIMHAMPPREGKLDALYSTGISINHCHLAHNFLRSRSRASSC